MKHQPLVPSAAWIGMLIIICPLFGAYAHDTSLDLSRYNSCDEFFCAGGNHGDSGLQTELLNRVGINIAPTQSIPESAPRVVIRPIVIGGSQGPGQRPAMEPSPDPGADPGTDNSPTQQAPPTTASGQPTGHNPQGGGHFGSQPGGFSGASMGGGNGQMVGGLLYRTDEPASNDRPGSQSDTQPSAMEPNKMQYGNTGNPSSSDRAKKSASNSQDTDNGRGLGMLGAQGNGSLGGAGNNGLGGAASGAAGGAGAPESLLAKIARGLGLDSFWGATGGGSNSQRRGAAANGQARNGALPAGGAGVNGRDPKALLQQQLNQLRRRGLASQLEFAPANSSLFQSMCHHYQDYAIGNRILASKQPCKGQ
jgi:hypothetical protein